MAGTRRVYSCTPRMACRKAMDYHVENHMTRRPIVLMSVPVKMKTSSWFMSSATNQNMNGMYVMCSLLSLLVTIILYMYTPCFIFIFDVPWYILHLEFQTCCFHFYIHFFIISNYVNYIYRYFGKLLILMMMKCTSVTAKQN